MFDLVAGNIAHVPSRPAMPIVISSVIESTVVAILAIGSLMAAATQPSVSPIMAFIARCPRRLRPRRHRRRFNRGR